MRTQAKIRRLQDIKTFTNQGRRSRLVILNELAQVERARVRMTQEKENWQKRMDTIDARLEQITEEEKELNQLLKEEDSDLNDRDGRLKESSGQGIENEKMPVGTVTIRY